MSSHDSELLTDDALASSISDDGRQSSASDTTDDDGIVEAGIPASSQDPDSEEFEEPFSIDDFETDMSLDEDSGGNETAIEPMQVPNVEVPLETASSTVRSAPSILKDTSNVLPTGQFAEFSKTLSARSRQLEVDRLTFLYQQLQANGSSLPPLDSIASDIRGDSPLHPLGDKDIYSKRPLARLQGWISGLSFGVGRRAKKFSR